MSNSLHVPVQLGSTFYFFFFFIRLKYFFALKQQCSQQRPDLTHGTAMKINTNRLRTVRPIINMGRSGVGKYGKVTIFELQKFIGMDLSNP